MSDQRNNNPPIEQLYYTWSAIGLDPISAGFRIRAASRELSEVGSPRVQGLDRYLRYVLPEGTDRFAITPDMAPLCLSLIQTERGERLLVYKTYTGKDGVGRLGAFFVHLLANLPPVFTAKNAILLWRSEFWKSSEDSISRNQLILNPVSLGELLGWRDKELDVFNVQAYLPFVIQAYLTRKAYQRLYIAASADAVASLIYGLTRCLPLPLLKDLTFSTYENDVLSKDQVLLVGTCWDKSVSARQDLPRVCYDEGLAINCISGMQSPLANHPLAASFAAYATQCLTTRAFKKLDKLISKTERFSNLDVNKFLEAYDSNIVNAQNPTIEHIVFYLNTSDAEMLSEEKVQESILALAVRDPKWRNDFLKPHLTSLFEQTKANPELADALSQLTMNASQKAALAANTDKVSNFQAMLDIMVWTANNKSEVWSNQPRLFAAQPNIHLFLRKHPDIQLNLLEMWSQIQPPINIELIRSFLKVPDPQFEDFYSSNIPPKWKDIATEAVITAAISGGSVQLLGQKYQDPIAILVQHLSQTAWQEAEGLFEKLANKNYPDKLHLLSLLLSSTTNLLNVERLLERAHLTPDERAKFLEDHGKYYLERLDRQYLSSSPRPVIMGWIKQHLQDFNPKYISRSSSAALDFLVFLRSEPIYPYLPLDIQALVQKWSTLSTFLRQPSTRKTDVVALGNILRQLLSTRNPELVERLAEAFVACVESETELASLISMMSTWTPFITKLDLIQMLYTMAEVIRDGMENPRMKQSAVTLLEPYTKFILCFESVYELPADEHALFVRFFLNTLLQSADDTSLGKLNARSNDWPARIAQKWQDYKPQMFHNDLLNVQRSTGKMPAAGAVNIQQQLANESTYPHRMPPGLSHVRTTESRYIQHQDEQAAIERHSSSTVAEQPQLDFFSNAHRQSKLKQGSSGGRMAKPSNWAIKLIDWLLEPIGEGKKTHLKRRE